MKENNKDIFASQGSSFTLKEYVFKYMSYWPVFLISLAICISAAEVYNRYATLKYRASVLILVKDDKPATSSRSADDLINNALTGEAKDNLDNEIQLLRSTELLEKVVIKNQFNISYFKKGQFKKTDLYLDAPFRLVPQTIGDSNKTVVVNVVSFTNDAIKYTIGKGEPSIHTVKWNELFKVGKNEFVLVPHGHIVSGDGDYIGVWNPVKVTAGELLSKTSVGMLDKKTSIIQLSIIAENLNRGEAILNALAKEFVQTDIDDKNAISQNTLRFIDDRLDVVSKELNGVEGNLENLQGSNGLVNAATQTTQSLESSNSLQKDLTDVNIQQGVVSMIMSYFNNPSNQGKLVPSSLGINDATLASLLGKYNELQLTRGRQASQVAAGSPILKDLDNQVNDVKGSIIESLQNISKNLKLQESGLQNKNAQYNSFLASLPHKERMMQEVKRKQSITEGLYLYLLQKREENAISASTTNVSVYKQIDPAAGSTVPVEPNKGYVFGYAILIGLLVPIGLIRLGFMLNDKISTRVEITKKISIPVLGELAHLPRGQQNGILVMGRTFISEQFRIIRTNLAFLHKNKHNKVVMVTSASVGEGKSLVSLNLASVLAVPGKKVALLEFDLRSPGITKKIGVEAPTGLSDFICGNMKNVQDIRYIMEDIPSLHIYPAGSLALNAADVLISEKISQLFDMLRAQYDYIIIDSAPTGLVSDAFILGAYSDATIFVVRMRQTLKKQLDFLNDIIDERKLTNVSVVINDVRVGRKHGYGYGYGKQYNYNYNYGVPKKRKLFGRLTSAYN